ncbi:MAG: hypothetical protein KR126chlam1_01013 [Chlamydiae bacterium]|nr:hypothetical protein [Chlamydiota bacterium]
MNVVVWITVLSIFLSGCGSYGYHPHYIISQDDAVEEVVEDVR